MVAERVRKTVEETQISKKIEIEKITISAGVTSFDKSTMKKASDLVEKADTGVYKAKHSGRNKVECIE